MTWMNKRGHGYQVHIMIGLVFIGLLLWFNHFLGTQQSPLHVAFSPSEYAFVLLITIIYSQMPDIDSDISVINKYFVTASLITIIVSFLYNWSEIGIAITAFLLIVEWVQHRGIFHTMLAGLLLAAPLIYFDWRFFAVAFVSHNIHLLSEGEWSLFT